MCSMVQRDHAELVFHTAKKPLGASLIFASVTLQRWLSLCPRNGGIQPIFLDHDSYDPLVTVPVYLGEELLGELV